MSDLSFANSSKLEDVRKATSLLSPLQSLTGEGIAACGLLVN